MAELNTSSINTLSQKVENAQKLLRGKLGTNPKAIEILKQLDSNPEILYNFSQRDRDDFYLIKRLVPDLFAEPKDFTKEIGGQKMLGAGVTPSTALYDKQKQAQETLEKGNISGLWDNPVSDKLVESGILPEIRDKTIPGMIGEVFKFPLQKVMAGLSTIPRYQASLVSESYKNAKEGKSPWDIQNALQSKGQVFKQTFEPFYKADSEYANLGWSDTLKEVFAGTKFAEPWKGTENWEQGNWFQRLFSGLAASPADITGLALDIGLDPLTYLSGGLAKGSKLFSLSDDLVKGGAKVLPKGQAALNKAGVKAFNAAKVSKWGRLFDGLESGKILPTAVKGITGTDDIAKQVALNIVENRAINKFVQETPDIMKYLDLGGTKFGSKTIIPGYKWAEKFGKVKNTGPVKTLGKLFDENADIPTELVPFKNWLLSAGEAERAKHLEDFATIIKNADEADLDKVQKYMWRMADIERKGKKFDDVVSSLDEFIKQNPEIDTIQKNYYKTKNLYGKDIETLNSELGAVNNKIDDIITKIDNDMGSFQLNVSHNTESSYYMDLLTDVEEYIKFNFGGIKYTATSADNYKKLPFNLKAKSGGLHGVSLDEAARDLGEAFPQLNIRYEDDLIEAIKDLRLKSKGKNLVEGGYNLSEDDLKQIFQDLFYEDFKKQSSVKNFDGTFKKGSIADLVLKRDDLEQRIKDLGAGQLFESDFYKNVLDNLSNKKLIDKYKSLKSSKTRYTNLLDKYQTKLDELGLNEKQLGLVDNLKEYWKRVADQYSQATGKPLDTYEFYSPIRYVKDEGQTLKQSILGAEKQPFSKSRAVTMDQAEALGLKPKSMIESTMQRLWEQEKNVFRSRLLEQAKQFGSDTAQEGFKQFDDIPELAGVYLPKEYENVVKNSFNIFFGDESFKKVLKIYDKGLTIWKRWALATPGYHFRNFFTDNVSGLMEYGPDFYNPKYWSDGMAVLKRKHKLINLNGVKRYADDVYDEMLETGEIALTTQTAVEGKLFQKTTGKLGKVDDAIKKLSIPEYSLKAGEFRENFGRVVAGVIERDNGASKIMSAANVKKVFFDYAHSLTPFEQNVMKRAIPFYTWMKNNIRRQVELLFTRTGAYAAIPKIMNFVEDISAKPEDYDEFKPDYYRDLGAMMTPLRQPGLPDFAADLLNREKTTQAGDPLVFNPNFAFQDWSRLGPKDMLSAASPFLKAPLELMLDKNIFLNAPISETPYGTPVKHKEIPGFMSKILSKLPDSALESLDIIKTEDGKVLIPPKMDYLLSQLPQYALTQRGFTGKDDSFYKNLSAGLGIKFFPYDEEKEKERYASDWIKEAQGEFQKYEQKTDSKLLSTTQLESAYRDMYEQAVSEKYADVLQLKELLKIIGSNRETDLALKKMLEPYYEEMDKAKGLELIELKKLLKEIGIEPSLLDIEDVRSGG
jgi:hypothetical protein